ncbi:MAG: thioesterase family protein [Bacteroidota bacterium]|nr:acyl-CoA thioesterase [Candidatus Kapabacteria bacterium]MDW8219952.1 thioesterase family protein [Bacteroidota bacterium]
MQSLSRSDFKHWTTLDVRWSELDPYGHVNNVAYCSYFEVARTRYILDAIDCDALLGNSMWHVMVHCSMNFYREVSFPAMLDIGLRVQSVRAHSYTMQCGIFHRDADTLVADGEGKLVTVNPSTKRPMAVPDNFRRACERIEQRSLS